MLDRLTAALVRRRGAWTAGAVLLFAIAAALASRLRLRHDANDFLPRRHDPVVAAPDATRDRLVIVLESSTPMQGADAGPVLDSLSRRLASLRNVGAVSHRIDPGIEQFLSVHAPHHLLLYLDTVRLAQLAERLSRRHMHRALLGAEGGIMRSSAERVLGVDKTDPLGVLTLVQPVVGGPSGTPRVRIVDGYFAAPDQTLYFMTVEPSVRLDDIADARGLVEAVEHVLRDAASDPSLDERLVGRNLLILGRSVAYVRGTDLALADIRRVTAAAAVLVLAILLLALRRPLASVLMLGTVAYGLVLTAAVATVVFGSVSLLGWIFIATLVGFGDEFALYIISHYWLSSDPAATTAEALASALRRPGPGIILGGLTSAAAFFSLVVVSYPVIWQMAWLTTIGLLLILAASFTVLPLALSWTAPGQGTDTDWYRWARPLARPPRRNGYLLAASAAAVCGALWIARGVRFEPHPWKVVVRGLPATAELDRIQGKLGISFTPFRMSSRATSAEAAVAADREASEALQAVQQRSGIAAIVTLSRWLPAADDQRARLEWIAGHREAFSAERFERDFREVAAQMNAPDTTLLRTYLPLIRRQLQADQREVTLAALGQEGLGALLARHVTQRGDTFIAQSDIYLTRLPWEKGTVDRFTRGIAAAGSPALERVQFSGDALRGATHAAVLRGNIVRATGLALGLTLLILLARFRRVRPVVLCLVPLLCGVAAALAAMAILGIELNVLTLAVAPLVIGLGSDDGIHVVDRLERGEPEERVLAETSVPMVITTLTTIAAFASLGFARFPGLQELGLVASFGLAVCLLVSLRGVAVLHAWRARPGAETS